MRKGQEATGLPLCEDSRVVNNFVTWSLTNEQFINY